jgi:hypothetical protein
LSVNAIGHVGICVSDTETSLRFWRDGLVFTHIAVWVSDIDAVARRVVEHGGTLIEETRTSDTLGSIETADAKFGASQEGYPL